MSPLNNGCSLSAFRANISELVSSGYSNKQAVAIAAEALRASCKKFNKPMPELGEIVPPAWENEAPCCAAELDPDKEGKKADFPFRPTTVWGVSDYKK